MKKRDTLKTQENLFLEAAKHGDLEQVKKILLNLPPQKAKNLFSLNVAAEAMNNAAEAGHVEVVRYLIEKQKISGGSWINCNTVALTSAVENGHIEVVKLLIKESNPEGNDAWPIMLASLLGHLDIVKLLLPFCTKKDTLIDIIFMAAQGGKTKTFRHLLSDIETPIIDPEVLNTLSLSLKLAAEKGYIDIVTDLIPIGSVHENQLNALTLAVKRGHVEMARRLIADGVSDSTFSSLIEQCIVENILEMLDPISLHLPEKHFRVVIEKAQENLETMAMMPLLKSYLMKERLTQEVSSEKPSKSRTRI